MLADDSEGGEQEGGLSLPALKTGCEATVKTVWPWQSSACLWQDPPHAHLAGAAAQSENSTVRLMFFIYWQLLTDMEKKYSVLPSTMWVKTLIVERLKYESLKTFTRA